MAEPTPIYFNQKAAEKLRSPDDLDAYVRVTNPSLWLVLFACLAIVAGLLAWGIFGAVTTNITTTGTVVKETPMCFLSPEEVAQVSVGDAAIVYDRKMTVVEVSAVPLSVEEQSHLLDSDYLVSALSKGNWAYRVTFAGDVDGLAEGVPLTVSITTERMAPISLILRNWG